MWSKIYLQKTLLGPLPLIFFKPKAPFNQAGLPISKNGSELDSSAVQCSAVQYSMVQYSTVAAAVTGYSMVLYSVQYQ